MPTAESGAVQNCSGDSHALVADRVQCIVLQAHIVAGGLYHHAFDQLREISDNLGTTGRCGADIVDTCIGVGAALFAELEPSSRPAAKLRWRHDESVGGQQRLDSLAPIRDVVSHRSGDQLTTSS